MSKAKPAAQAENQSPADTQPESPFEMKLPHAEQDKMDEIQAHKSIKRWLFEWSAADLVKLYYFGQILERNVDNASTPIEHFITVLPTQYCWTLRGGREFDFKQIQSEVDEAKAWFEDAIAITRMMTKQYPQTIAQQEEE